MTRRSSALLFAIGYSLSAFLACGRPAGVGLGGRYLDGRWEVTKTRGANIDKAIEKLEGVVKQDPLYKDSLTLLGRTYYRKGRYQDAFQILQRALAVNKDDEIAWITLGLTQLRLGDDQRGLESLKGGLSLLARVSKNGYKGIEFWDKKGLVKSALRWAVLFTAKGVEEKEKLIRQTEILLGRIDDEEHIGRQEEESELIQGF